MTIKKTSYMALALCGVLATSACNNDVEQPAANEAYLQLEMADFSRAALDGTRLPDGAVFTVACVNTKSPYQKQVSNVTYSGGSCVIENPIVLTDGSFTVGALYPAYDLKEWDGNMESFTVDAAKQIDYMTARVEGVTYYNSTATLKMSHILSRITFNIRKESFITKDMVVEMLKLADVNTTGEYSITSMKYASTKGGTLEAKVGASLSSADYITVDLLVVPTSKSTAKLSLVRSDEDKVMSLDWSHEAWVAGTRYVYNVTVSAENLKVEGGKITPWDANESIDATDGLAAPGNPVDLGLSKMWADRNVGAFTSAAYGSYLPADYQAELASYWGDNWSIPTADDFTELIEKCKWQWTAVGNVQGYRVSGNGNSIFLPAAGFVLGGAYNDYNWGGSYWSSSAAMSLGFSNAAFRLTDTLDAAAACSIRPVCVKAADVVPDPSTEADMENPDVNVKPWDKTEGGTLTN